MMMPTIFLGHGSPMNAIEDNEFTKGWREISNTIPRPDSILAISAHWFTEGTRVQTEMAPKTIHDFYGFPKKLIEAEYPVPGAPNVAERAIELLGNDVLIDNSWGVDHGAWSVLGIMYPYADIPVCQMSVNQNLSPKAIFEIGAKLKPLRDENIMIIGSGNIVHNLSLVDFSMSGGYDWADEFDQSIYSAIQARDFDRIIDYKKTGDCAKYAFSTPEHFNPLLYVLGASDEKDKLSVYNHSRTMGSLSMTSYVFSE
jgi:4,5-DOPA dioxygenase extradiol